MSYKNNRLKESFDLKKRLEVADVIMEHSDIIKETQI
jgi:hypothetical protein